MPEECLLNPSEPDRQSFAFLERPNESVRALDILDAAPVGLERTSAASDDVLNRATASSQRGQEEGGTGGAMHHRWLPCQKVSYEY